MAKYKSLVFREFKIIKKYCCLMVLFFITFTALVFLSLFVLKGQAQDEGVSMDGFVRIASYIVGIIGAAIISENNGLYKSDINSGWLTYSWVLPLSAFEKAKADYIVKGILIISAMAISVLSAVGISIFCDCSVSLNTIFSFALFFDVAMIFDIIRTFFSMQAKEENGLKKMSGIASAVIIALLFVPELFSNGGGTDKLDELFSEANTETIGGFNKIISLLQIPDYLGYIGAGLIVVLFVVGFVVTMKCYERREP